MKKYLLIIGVMLLTMFACRSDDIPYSKDLFIEFTSGPAAADRGPVTFIRVHPDGTGGFLLESGKIFTFISKTDGKKKTKEDILRTKNLTEDQVKNLVGTFNDSGFFDLDKFYRDPDILDGDVKLIYIRLGSVEKNVVCLNYIQKGFKSVEKGIKSLWKP